VVLAGRHASRRTSIILHWYSLTSLVQRSGDGDAVITVLNALLGSYSFFCFCYVLDVSLRLLVEV
jgi:hypothetical protein